MGTVPAKKRKYSNTAVVLRKAVKMLHQVIQSILRGVPINMISVFMQILAVLVTIFCILLIHEYAHGWMTKELGDNTAAYQGHLTINPLVSIDPLGALAILLFGSGWAKPAPADTRDPKSPKRDIAITALAGPASNILAALLGAILLNVTFLFQRSIPQSVQFGVAVFFGYYINISVMLAVLNLILLPPPDGPRALTASLSDRAMYRYYQNQWMIMLVPFALLFLGFLNEPLYLMQSWVRFGIIWLTDLSFVLLGVQQMEKLEYHLDMSDGPLDLSLALIAKNKVEACDISISDLSDQYMGQIGKMQEQQMETSSEFSEMAVCLVYLKTVSLLPKNEGAEELRRELTGQLMEYQGWKRTTQALGGLFSWDLFVRQSAPLPPEWVHGRSHHPDGLLAAYLSAAGGGKHFLPPSAISFSGIVTRKPVSVAPWIILVFRRLWKKRRMPFHDLLWESRQKSDLAATFLAVLELAKNHRVRVDGEESGMTITLLTGGADPWK